MDTLELKAINFMVFKYKQAMSKSCMTFQCIILVRLLLLMTICNSAMCTILTICVLNLCGCPDVWPFWKINKQKCWNRLKKDKTLFLLIIGFIGLLAAYSSWLYLTEHCYTHTNIHTRALIFLVTFFRSFLVTVSNGSIPPTLGSWTLPSSQPQ